MHPVFGASLLSAAASLPLHMMPLIVVAALTESRLQIAQAGWIASAYMLGQMLVVLALPATGFTHLRRAYACGAVLVTLGALALSGGLTAIALLLPWLVIGAACGSLQFLGATTAAAAPDKEKAFAMRLAISLLVSGTAITAVQLTGGFGGYASLAIRLSVVFAVLAVVGLVLYREPHAPTPAPKMQAGMPIARFAGLAAIFLLFAGQLGFWAFAVQSVQQRGVVLEHVAYAIAVCKAIAGLVLLVNIWGHKKGPVRNGLLWPGIVLATGVASMAFAHESIVFFVGLLLWELGLNLLSARIQAAVVRDNPGTAGPWLTSAIFLGAVAGPIFNGLTIQQGAPIIFIACACLSALIPFAWSTTRRTAK